MDVEDVVRWACGQELPKKRFGGTAQSASAAIRGSISRREASLVGRWDAPAGFPEVSPMFARGFASSSRAGRGGPPDSDAIVVEAAIQALRLEQVAPIEQLTAGIGFAVDATGAWDYAVGNVVNLVLPHGRLGNRPTLFDEKFQISPTLAPNGRPAVFRIEAAVERTTDGRDVTREFEASVVATRKGLYPDGSYGVIVYDPDPMSVVAARAEYLAWRVALDALAEALSGRMERLTALPPAAATAPWLGDVDGDPVRHLFAASAIGVHGAAEVARMRADREKGRRREISRGPPRLRKAARPARVAARKGV